MVFIHRCLQSTVFVYSWHLDRFECSYIHISLEHYYIIYHLNIHLQKVPVHQIGMITCREHIANFQMLKILIIWIIIAHFLSNCWQLLLRAKILSFKKFLEMNEAEFKTRSRLALWARTLHYSPICHKNICFSHFTDISCD